MTASVALLKGFDTRHFWNDIDGNSTTLDPNIWAFPQEVLRFARILGDFDYNGGDVAIGNTYSQIEIYDDAGFTDLVATFTSTTPITFTDYSASEKDALDGDDTFTGSPENDVITGHAGADNADGKDGSDSYRYNNGDVAAGEIVNDTGAGVGDFDALFIIGDNVDFRLATELSGLEGITYDAPAGDSTAIFNGDQFGGTQLPDNVTITGRTGQVDNLLIKDVTNLDAVAWALNNLGDEDTVTLEGTAGANIINGSSAGEIVLPGGGADTINTGGGDDIVVLFNVDDVAGLSINGGTGTDEISIAGSNVDLRPATTLLNLEGITFEDAPAGVATVILNNTQVGGGGLPNNLTITGRPAAEDIVDIRVAGILVSQFFQFIDWNDEDLIIFRGSPGFKDITGTSKNDLVIPGTGFALINLGDGNDVVQLNGAFSGFINGGNGTDGIEALGPLTFDFFNATNSSIENWFGNKIVQGTNAETLLNLAAIESLTSPQGPPPAAGTNGLTLNGLGGNDNIVGTKLGDKIDGGTGNDILNGFLGSDKLTGGKGKDTMTGGGDKDVFDFNNIKESGKGGQADRITDFKKGQDDIDLRDVYGPKLKFIGKDDFNDKKGEVRYEDKGSKVVVQVDTNGDGKSDMDIKVDVGSLGKGDFLL